MLRSIGEAKKKVFEGKKKIITGHFHSEIQTDWAVRRIELLTTFTLECDFGDD